MTDEPRKGIRYVALITRVADGVTRHFAENWMLWDIGVYYLWYHGGNYACDCNRAAFFARAHDEPPTEDGITCGEGRFLVRLVDADDGSVLFDDPNTEETSNA